MDADGSNLRRLTHSSGNDLLPDWSPDGTQIAFMSDRDGDWDIFVMDADGSNLRRLTNNSGNDLFPNWSPDGRKIVFESDRDGDWDNQDIYVMDLLGGCE